MTLVTSTTTSASSDDASSLTLATETSASITSTTTSVTILSEATTALEATSTSEVSSSTTMIDDIITDASTTDIVTTDSTTIDAVATSPIATDLTTTDLTATDPTATYSITNTLPGETNTVPVVTSTSSPTALPSYLANPGFEENPQTAWTLNNSMQIDPTFARDGSSSLKVALTNPHGVFDRYQAINPDIDILPNVDYTLSVWVYTESTDDSGAELACTSIKLFCKNLDGADYGVKTYSVPWDWTYGWNQMSTTFRLPVPNSQVIESPTIYFRFETNNCVGQPYWLDSVEVKRA